MFNYLNSFIASFWPAKPNEISDVIPTHNLIPLMLTMKVKFDETIDHAEYTNINSERIDVIEFIFDNTVNKRIFAELFYLAPQLVNIDIIRVTVDVNVNKKEFKNIFPDFFSFLNKFLSMLPKKITLNLTHAYLDFLELSSEIKIGLLILPIPASLYNLFSKTEVENRLDSFDLQSQQLVENQEVTIEFKERQSLRYKIEQKKNIYVKCDASVDEIGLLHYNYYCADSYQNSKVHLKINAKYYGMNGFVINNTFVLDHFHEQQKERFEKSYYTIE